MEAKRQFPVFNSHLDLAKEYWRKVARPGDWAIDATCGNGHDTSALCKLFTGVIGLDIQPQAILATKNLLKVNGQTAELYCQSHDTFPDRAGTLPIRLIVYNLGYLPNGNKELTTMTESTLQSINEALKLIRPGGLISVTCYPGHPEGAKEAFQVGHFAKDLDPALWSVSSHQWLNRHQSPYVILIQKKN